MGEMKSACRILVCGDLTEGEHLQDPGVDGMKTFDTNLQGVGRVARTGWSWLRIGTGGGLL